MVPVTPALIEPWHALRVTGGGTTVAASAFSGLEIAGTIGGVVGATVAIGMLAVTISANNRQKRREYEDEIQESFDRGAASIAAQLHQARRDAEFWRAQFFGRKGVPPELDDDGEQG